jgi:hypothetical protein
MATDQHTGTEPKMADLMAGILGDFQELLKQQMALLRTEVRDDFQKTREALTSLALGVGLAVLGGVLLCVMLVHLLDWAIPGLPLWGAFAIVGGLLAGTGAALVYWGRLQFDTFNPLPNQTADALKENVQWLMNKK